MFDDPEPIPAALACTLVAMIDKTGSWRTKADIILAVASQEGGAWWTSSDVADQVGRDHGTCRRYMAQLEAERVIVRLSGPEKNARKFWVELNPDWTLWRVPWRLPRRTVRQRVAYAQQEATKDPVERLIAHSYGARYSGIIAQQRKHAMISMTRREKRPHRARIETRDSDKSTGRNRAWEQRKRPVRQPGSRAHTSRVFSVDSEEEDLLTSARDEPSSSVHGFADEEEEASTTVSEVDRREAQRALLQKCRAHNGRRWLGGRPAKLLDELIETYGVAAVKAAIDDRRIPPDAYIAPELVGLLADSLAAGQQAPLPGLDPAPDPRVARARLERQLHQLDVLIATAEQDGWGTPAEMLDERERLAKDLAALEAESYDRPDA